MTPEELKLLVKVPISTLNKISGIPNGFIPVYIEGSDGKMELMDIDNFNNLSKTAKPLKPTDATPTEEGLYMPTESGTYANAGGLIAQEGYYTLFFFDGTTWTKSEFEFPNINLATGLLDPKNTTQAVTGNQVADYVEDPKSIGGVGETIEINVNLSFTDGKYIDSQGNIQNLSSYELSDPIEIPQGGNVIETDFGSLFTIAEFNENQVFLRNVGVEIGLPDETPFFYKPSDLSVKFIRYSHYKPNGTAYLKITNYKYSLPFLISESSNEAEFSKRCKIGDVKMINFNDFVLPGNVIISGDSTIASYLGGESISNILKCSGTMTNIAVPNEDISQQLGHWNALSPTIKSNSNFVFVQIGLNNIDFPQTPTSDILTELSSYIQQIKTDAPNAFIVLGQMNPAKGRWIASFGQVNGSLAQKQWEELNAGMLTIPNVNAVATVHTWLLNDGNGNLRQEFETSANDHIHENTNGRKMIAYSWLISVY